MENYYSHVLILRYFAHSQTITRSFPKVWFVSFKSQRCKILVPPLPGHLNAFWIVYFNLLTFIIYLVVENINDTINQLQPVDIKVRI